MDQEHEMEFILIENEQPQNDKDVLFDLGCRYCIGFKHENGQYYENYFSDKMKIIPVRWLNLPSPLYED